MLQRVSIETVKDITGLLMTSSFKKYCYENLYTGINTSKKFITPIFLNHTEDEGINFPRNVGTSDAYVKKGKAIPVQAWTNPEGCRKLRLQGFQDIRCMKVAKLSALRNKSMKNPNDNNMNRTLDLPACGAVRQPTSPPRTPDARVNYE